MMTQITKEAIEAAPASSSPGKDGGQEVGAVGEWIYQIQYGPEGEADYAWVYRAQEMVATMKTHHARALCSALSASQSTSRENADV